MMMMMMVNCYCKIFESRKWVKFLSNHCQRFTQTQTCVPLDAGRNLNVHKTFRILPGLLLNVLFIYVQFMSYVQGVSCILVYWKTFRSILLKLQNCSILVIYCRMHNYMIARLFFCTIIRVYAVFLSNCIDKYAIKQEIMGECSLSTRKVLLSCMTELSL